VDINISGHLFTNCVVNDSVVSVHFKSKTSITNFASINHRGSAVFYWNALGYVIPIVGGFKSTFTIPTSKSIGLSSFYHRRGICIDYNKSTTKWDFSSSLSKRNRFTHSENSVKSEVKFHFTYGFLSASVVVASSILQNRPAFFLETDLLEHGVIVFRHIQSYIRDFRWGGRCALMATC